ncbi:cob(I)yrinic acid a,c-diamide adenosyltransferase [Sphingomonas baiyangensis]|uniref:Corrinoid adenosyltransferase n=1 Tax=Sphingomonas baiyangensis TaxID=2572576 RepID=A0A4U1L7C7_9SPHN|nr:cob(I)yrinic acid a,c-diamide adenosyltransferase [Sphingomonas baiyangensis]TKD52136.1 cob(I)yrinic acid a,c-diamide adenosyltransferase [Sphingomonas baiyangensis]
MVKLNRIYTRTGDTGTTGLVDGSRVSKADPLIAAIGDVDEANSAIGVALAGIDDAAIGVMLGRIQNEMFDLGADLATPWNPDAHPDAALRVTPHQVAALEADIDRLNGELEPLSSFILPGGSPVAASMHLARAIVRRAERAMVSAGAGNTLNPAALTYINRLSDLLFILARYVNKNGPGDVLWKPGASR